MTDPRPEAASRYIEWAKLHSGAPLNLAVSGVLDYPLAELPVRIEDLEIGGTGPYGYEPLLDRLAKKSGAAVENVVYTFGTSMARSSRREGAPLRAPTGQGISPGSRRTRAPHHTANTAGGSLQPTQSQQCPHRRRHFATGR